MNESCFDEEHHALDHTLADVAYLAKKGSFLPAGKRFFEFRNALERHQREEEAVLFPFFLERTGDPDGVLPQMRAQHEQLAEAMNEVSAALSQENLDAFGKALTGLTAQLAGHHELEERLLHRGLDWLLPNAAEWRKRVSEALPLPPGSR